jgi:hypothetical protein
MKVMQQTIFLKLNKATGSIEDACSDPPGGRVIDKSQFTHIITIPDMATSEESPQNYVAIPVSVGEKVENMSFLPLEEGENDNPETEISPPVEGENNTPPTP